MKISIVMSSYNGEKYIKSQLKSILNQEESIDEVLIRDDGSTDNTVDIVRQFIKEHNLTNWQIRVNFHNLGWRANFIEGMLEAQGDLIFFCDQDDIWRTDKLKIMKRIMLSNPQINVLASDYQELLSGGKGKIGPYTADDQVKKVELYKNYMYVKAPGCTYCVRKKFAVETAKFWNASYPHDALVWRLALFTDSLYICREPLIYWRQHKTSAFAKESRLLKSRSKKYQLIKASKKFNNSIRKFLLTFYAEKVTNRKEKLVLTSNAYLNLRMSFYDSKNPIYGLRLIKYLKYYPRYRQYLADWYLVYFNHN